MQQKLTLKNTNKKNIQDTMVLSQVVLGYKRRYQI